MGAGWFALAAALAAGSARAPEAADRIAFRDLYRELVETDTVAGTGGCTRAAAQVAARLRAAGFVADELTPFAAPDHPGDGGLVAVLPGREPARPALLLLAHLDVVAVERGEWKRDPFRLVEEGGYFYGRGTIDDKAMAAIFADTMIRLRRQGTVPRRTVKLALTCGEETIGAFNGARWLARNRPDLIAAGFALNEGGGGQVDPAGRVHSLSVQVGEKAAQNFTLTAVEPGGHSATPGPDNAIYRLADALRAVQAHDFPLRFTDTTRAYFQASLTGFGPVQGEAIRRLLDDPGDQAAAVTIGRDRVLRAMLRTTCVPTLLSAGLAENALPQRATANVNCRLLPGDTVPDTLATLRRVVGAGVAVTANDPARPVAVAQRLDPAVLDPMRRVASRHFPAAPLVPTMSPGATDGIFLQAIGIPVYGVPGLMIDPDRNGIHGRDERIRVSALYAGRAYLHDLVRAYVE